MPAKILKRGDRGPYVRRLQRILRDNKYGDFMQGAKLDGEYGPLTAAAVYRAKYWLGYGPKQLSRDFVHPTTIRLLLGAPLPGAHPARRAFRLRKKAEANDITNKRRKMVAIAKSQVGTSESPAGTNRVKFSVWYGMIGPWCAMFDTWCGVQAGLTAFKRGARWAYVPYMDDDADHNRNGVFSISFDAAREGDVANMHFGSGISKHTGIVAARRGSYLVLVEGNTSSNSLGSQDNGGTVAVKVRHRSDVRRVIRIKH